MNISYNKKIFSLHCFLIVGSVKSQDIAKKTVLHGKFQLVKTEKKMLHLRGILQGFMGLYQILQSNEAV